MAKFEEQVYIKYRYALAIKMLQEKNKKLKKKNDKKGIEDINLDQSYDDISSSTGLRKATISNIITGVSEIKSYTLYLILKSLGFSYSQFGKVFDNLSEQEVCEYIVQIEEERKQRQLKH
jgi:transcriptional regulator with XRE-family HTH domain